MTKLFDFFDQLLCRHNWKTLHIVRCGAANIAELVTIQQCAKCDKARTLRQPDNLGTTHVKAAVDPERGPEFHEAHTL